MPKHDNDIDLDLDEDLLDDPIPAKRDTRIFQRKKEHNSKDEDFEEDVFV